MKKNIRYWVLLTCIVVLTGCDVKILKDKDEETVGKEKENIRLYVTEEKKEKDINEIPTNLYQVKKEEEYSIFKDQENNFYITIDNIYYEKEDAMAYIYKNNLLDFGEKYKVEESLKEITQEKVEFKRNRKEKRRRN